MNFFWISSRGSRVRGRGSRFGDLVDGKVADRVAHMVADVEVDKLADMVSDMDFSIISFWMLGRICCISQ